jgi:hypothetical protein
MNLKNILQNTKEHNKSKPINQAGNLIYIMLQTQKKICKISGRGVFLWGRGKIFLNQLITCTEALAK